jgi:hypothetical protein
MEKRERSSMGMEGRWSTGETECYAREGMEVGVAGSKGIAYLTESHLMVLESLSDQLVFLEGWVTMMAVMN